MAHWTDDPKIHALMAHLGKTGATGKPTRSAYVASQIKRILTQIEPRLVARASASLDEKKLTSEYEDLTAFAKNRSKLEIELRANLRMAKRDFLKKNPTSDAGKLDVGAQKKLSEFGRAQERAIGRIEELKKSLTMRRTSIRRMDDRMKHYRRQVNLLLAQVRKSGKSAA